MMPSSDSFRLSRGQLVDLAMRTVLPCVGVFILISGVLCIVSFALVPMGDYALARGWVQAEARVEHFKHQARGRGLSWPFPHIDMRYRYVLDNTEYVGEKLGFHGGVERDEKRIDELSATLKPGRTIPVWVDPENPRRSVASRELDWHLVALAIPGLAFCAIGVLLVVVGMLSWTGKPESMSSESLP